MAMFGHQLYIEILGNQLGSVRFSRPEHRFPAKWQRLAPASFSKLLDMSYGMDITPTANYAYDELLAGGPEFSVQLGAAARSKEFKRALWPIILLGARGNATDVQQLVALLDDPRPRVVSTTVLALGEATQKHPTKSITSVVNESLLSYLATHPNSQPDVVEALSKAPTPAAIGLFRKEAASPHSEYSLADALHALAALHDEASLDLFRAHLDHPNAHVRIGAIRALSQIAPREISASHVEFLMKTATQGNWPDRADAIESLASLEQGRDTIAAALSDQDSIVRRVAATALKAFGKVTDHGTREKLRALLWDKDTDVRNAAAEALGVR